MIDSNVLAPYLDPDNVDHEQVKQALAALIEKKLRPCYVPQIAVEMANFLTRPAIDNGFGFTPDAAAGLLDGLERTFTLLFPDAQVEYRLFRDLKRELSTSGKQVHDIRIVAACRSLGIRKVLTQNARHFARAAAAGHIEAITPAATLAS